MQGNYNSLSQLIEDGFILKGSLKNGAKIYCRTSPITKETLLVVRVMPNGNILKKER